MTQSARRDLLIVVGVVAAAAAVLVGRSLGRGVFLYRDFVTVPDPVVGAATWGAPGSPPRSAPLDAVVVALAPVLPPGVQQQVMLVGALVLAGLGTALLVRSWGLAAMVPSAVVAMWNPFVVERLLLGQPPTLLAYSMTPWLILAVRSRLAGWRGLAAVAVAAAPAALTPWGGLWALGVVLVTALATPWRSGRWWFAALTLGAGWCLPWVIPGLHYATTAADPDGANAFAAQSDSPLGVLVSVATLGGIWAPAAVPGSRSTTLSIAVGVALFVVALVGLVVLARDGHRRAAAWLGCALVVPPAVVTLLATGPGIGLMRAAQALPGVAVARDTHRWVGPAATATAVLVGVVAASVAQRLRRIARAAVAPTVAAVLATCSFAVLAVPDAPTLLHAAYQPVGMPPGWAAAVDAADQAAGDRAVLVLPWSAFRAARSPSGYNRNQPFLDPLSRALAQRVISSRELVVSRQGVTVTVDDDPGGLTRLASDPSPAALEAAGIGAVVVWTDVRGPAVPAAVRDLELVERAGSFEVWRVTRP
ncbi:hypothetical protein [Knoellia koreensis]|uniref:Glycosyltransferase RgtA/B/C/D-like domain-containing protein n=1 Tax=Knoellia koreensis TaxID=2730921 RepID=A0A849HJG6_9MICO|nr:hypothetical protein [Knoellia sp. DB2414S]NNM44797.1 hypothetical protein [Knoellia sp. DB2414S]